MKLASDEVGAARDALIAAAHRILRLSANSTAAIAIAFGIAAILVEPQVLSHGWLHVKLAFVFGLLACHFQLYRRVIATERDPGSLSRRQFVLIHGLVSAFLMIILVMVIVKPF